MPCIATCQRPIMAPPYIMIGEEVVKCFEYGRQGQFAMKQETPLPIPAVQNPKPLVPTPQPLAKANCGHGMP